MTFSMKKCVLLALTLALFSGVCRAQEAFYTEMPGYLRVTQETVSEKVAKDVYIQRTYPTTANEAVNAQMRALVDRMAEAKRDSEHLAVSGGSACLDVGPVITRTGTSWMSFLTLAEIAAQDTAKDVAFETRVYDIETGRQIALTDVFAEDSAAWDMLSEAVRTQLGEAFPGEQPDEERLEALTSREELKKAAFTMGAVRMTLTYHAGEIYKDKVSLLHVHLYYPEIRSLMTQEAQRQTDNERFRMVALTFDDGSAYGNTRRVLDQLRIHGAQATFFIVGRTIQRNHDNVTRQQNGNYSIQNHSYAHKYSEEMTTKKVFDEKARFEEELVRVTGVKPTMMRAPGGEEFFYTRREIGYPMIHWSVAGGDSGSKDAKKIHSRVVHRVYDGAIVLLHDSNALSPKYTGEILADLHEMGYLCVTLEELFADNGVVPEADTVYHDVRTVQ